jgi:hypothetical protein
MRLFRAEMALKRGSKHFYVLVFVYYTSVAENLILRKKKRFNVGLLYPEGY